MTRSYVLGHQNPDTDSIAAAMGYAWVLQQLGDTEIAAARIGPLNRQTAWVLERLGLQSPAVLADASPLFSAVSRPLTAVPKDQPLCDAWEVLSRDGAATPVVDESGRPYGLISGVSLFAWLSRQLGPQLDAQDKPIRELFSAPCSEASDTGVPQFKASDRIRDRLPRVLREERDDFWVVGEQGEYLGVCRKPDLLTPPRMQLVLVDHNEVGQSIGSLGEAVILEVLDHHRLDTAPTRLPIRFHVDPVGSTSTLVAERAAESGLEPPPALAGLLLAGVVSDTLLFRSPTSTPRDQQAAERLIRWAAAAGAPLAGETIETFGRRVLEAGAGLATLDPQAVVSGDFKIYNAGENHFGVAQVEVTNLDEVEGPRQSLLGALEELRVQRGLGCTLLMITDIIKGCSRILLSEEAATWTDLPFTHLPDGSLEAPGMVSRKKQLLPLLLDYLEG